MGVSHGFEKNETATMFFLEKPSLVFLVVMVDTDDTQRTTDNARAPHRSPLSYCSNAKSS